MMGVARTTGVVRRIDALGRVVIPKELRDAFSLKVGDPMEFLIAEDGFLIRLYQPGCIFCGSTQVSTYRGRLVCDGCRDELGGDE